MLERMLEMEYLKLKEKLEETKRDLVNRMQNPALTTDEKEELQKAVSNYEYIIELVDMNHFERGSVAE